MTTEAPLRAELAVLTARVAQLEALLAVAQRRTQEEKLVREIMSRGYDEDEAWTMVVRRRTHAA